MSKSIERTSLLEILPHSLRNDPDIVAASQAVDTNYSSTVQEVDKLTLFKDLDKQDESVIDHLLHQSRYTEIEIALASTIQEKIDLIENAYEVHRIKGTKLALERILDILNMRGKISEWYKYGGSPYFFKVDIEVSSRGLSDHELILLDNLIETHKNKRSWVEVVNLFLTGRGKMHMASIFLTGEEITVYPWRPRMIETHGAVKLGAAAQSYETFTVYPQ